MFTIKSSNLRSICLGSGKEKLTPTGIKPGKFTISGVQMIESNF